MDIKELFGYNMGYKPGERILVVTDTRLRNLGYKVYSAMPDATIIETRPRVENGSEPEDPVRGAMLESDIIMILTSKSLTHTKARRDACAGGARVASMPGITPAIFRRMLGTDYQEMLVRSTRLAAKLKKAKTARISTEAGTDMTMEIAGRKVDDDTGILRKAGDYGNLPAGEVSLSPLEGTAEGVFVIDGSVISQRVDMPVKITVRKGMAVSIEGGRTARQLLQLLTAVGPKAFNIAELGIGTNENAKLTGNILEDEKILGTCHIALGNNMSYGGTVDVPIHQDGIILSPDIYLDGKRIMEKGQLL